MVCMICLSSLKQGTTFLVTTQMPSFDHVHTDGESGLVWVLLSVIYFY